MLFNGEQLKPERGFTETLPWGAVRVAGRNRRDTVSNPSYYNVTFSLVGQAMIDWFGRWWWTEALEGSVPIETGIGWAQVIGKPTFSNNNGRSASVSMRLEIENTIGYCDDISIINIGESLGDQFPIVAYTLETALYGN